MNKKHILHGLGSLSFLLVFLLFSPTQASNTRLFLQPNQTESQSLSQSSLTAEDFLLQGIQKLDAEDYQGAIEAFNEAIRLNPKLDLAYTSRGFAHSLLENYQAAIEDFNQAIKLNPKGQ